MKYLVEENRLKELEKDSEYLNALHRGGVDNWTWYDDSIENVSEEKVDLPTDNLAFGEAIEALKSGYRVSRKGWNGKDMYLYLQSGKVYAEADIPKNAYWVDTPEGVSASTFSPCIVMKTVDGLNQPGWLASQTDILAEDWIILT